MKRLLWLSPAVLVALLWAAPKKPVYVGARACGQCHEGAGMGHQYSKWLTSKHARAYATLALPQSREIAKISGITGDPMQAPICLGCHAVATNADAWERDDTFRFADGMQCEGCHGPGSEYANEETMRDRAAAMKAGLRMPGETYCMVCHIEKGTHVNVLKTPAFDFQKAKAAIAHPLPRTARRLPANSSLEVAPADMPQGTDERVWSMWRLGPHGQAFGVLSAPKSAAIAAAMNAKGEPTESPTCLKCHGPGPAASDGVTCKSCHDGNAKPTAATCAGCHANAHGKPFVYAAAVRKITHGKPLTPPPAETRYKNPLRLRVRPDSQELWITLEGANAVAVVDLATKAKIAEFSVGEAPTGICFSPDGATAFVSNRSDDTVMVIDAAKRKVKQTVPVGDEPHGLAVDRAGSTLYVLNTASDDITVLDARTLQRIKVLRASNGPWSAALSPDGSQLLISNTYSHETGFRTPLASETTVIDTVRQRVEDRRPAEGTNLMTGIAWHPSGEFALAAMNRTKSMVPMTRLEQGWTITNGLALIWRDGRIDQVLLDEPNLGFADATDVAFTPDGRHALVSSSGTDRVAVVDVARLRALVEKASEQDRKRTLPNHLGSAAQYIPKYIRTGASPRGIAISPDGKLAFVANSLSDSLTVIALDTMESSGEIGLGGPREITKQRRGERLFHNASVAFRKQFSCHSCHPDGHVDRITYDIEADGIGISPVDNRTLRGILDTAPFKWEGTNPSLQRQCGARLAVFFTRGLPFTKEQLSDLDYYITTIPRPPNRYRKPGVKLTPAQQRGKVIFQRETTNGGKPIPPEGRCITCHPAPYYTNRQRFDVGTRQPSDRQALFDVPHLNNIYDSAPYLHNGMAKTLEEIWTLFNPYDKHGVTNDMTKDQLNDLIEFLKTL